MNRRINPTTLAAVAVAFIEEPYRTRLAEAWIAENGDTPEARSDARERLHFIKVNPEAMAWTLSREVAKLSPLGRLRFTLALRRARREAALA